MVLVIGQIFQSTHPCGVRQADSGYFNDFNQFQSTHPCGVRRDLLQKVENIYLISIHAPMWGATINTVFALNIVAIFQSTHPCGVRRAIDTIPQSRQEYFNPRTHVGCDKARASKLDRLIDFNPRTHVGCDNLCCLVHSGLIYFNPRTHVGCDGELHFTSKGL